MKKISCFKSNSGKICEYEMDAARENLRDLRKEIEQNWLWNVEHPDRLKLLAHIYEYLKVFIKDMDDYKRKFTSYQEKYVNYIHYENYDHKI